MIYAHQPIDELMDILVALAMYPFRHNTFLESGHTIAGSNGAGVIEASPLTDILVVKAVKEPGDFRVLHLAEGKAHVDILWVVPIYPSERLYKIEHGLEALIDLFAEKDIDTADFFRESVV